MFDAFVIALPYLSTAWVEVAGFVDFVSAFTTGLVKLAELSS